MKKLSLFNVFIPRSKSCIVYNTLWDTFLVVGEGQASLLQSDQVEEGNFSEELYQAFVAKKILVDTELDELSIARGIYEQVKGDPSHFEIVISPTLDCNFRCWYCYESHRDKAVISAEDLQNLSQFVSKLISGDTTIESLSIKFFGGEPLLCFDDVMQPFLSELRHLRRGSSVKVDIGITTNGYLLSHDRLLFLKEHGVNNLQITIDGNQERHNRVRFSQKGDDSYRQIIANILVALSLEYVVNLRLNISEDTALNVADLLQDFSVLSEQYKKFLVFSIHKVWQADDAVHAVISDIVQDIRSQGYQCVSYFSRPSTLRDICYADKPNHITLNPRGEIYKCTARDFTSSNVEGYLRENGAIEWTELHTLRERATPFEVEACCSCPILPICAGGCSQHLIEAKDLGNVCPLGMSQEDKQDYAYNVLNEKLERL